MACILTFCICLFFFLLDFLPLATCDNQWWQQHATATPSLALRQDTAWIREDKSWKGPSIVPELSKRWVEITGPAGDAKMVINALNSGANGYMADLEDSQVP